MKLIFVTSCKPITNDNIKTIQENSLNSWKWLNCEKEIFVFNKDESIKKLVSNLGLNLVTDYESSESSDLPTWRTMRNFASNIATDNDYIVWINSDIIVDDSLPNTIFSIKKDNNLDNFVLTGKRKNWKNYFKITDSNQISNLVLESEGDKWEIDYFVFKKQHFSDLPKFYIARMRFDNYLLSKSISEIEHTIDCSQTVNLIHHFHGYGDQLSKPWHEYSKENNVSKEVSENFVNCVGLSHLQSCNYFSKFENTKIKIVKKK